MFLDFYVLSFRLLALEPILFPVGKAGNVLRGAFGQLLREHSCRPQCSGAQSCSIAAECAYAQIFEPRASTSDRSVNRPRSFVFRADHLDGHSVAPGQSFDFEINLFDRSTETLKTILDAFSAIHELGSRRGKTKLLNTRTHPQSVPLAPATSAVSSIRVDFATPTELKALNKVVVTPEFPILYARAAQRITALSSAPLALPDPPSDIQLIESALTDSDIERRSSKTGQRHRIGGFVGHTIYQGNLREYLPVLKAAEFTGVGRHTSWGNGRLLITVLD